MSAARLERAAAEIRAILLDEDHGVYAMQAYLEAVGLQDVDLARALAGWLEQHAETHSTYDCMWDDCAALDAAAAILREPASTPRRVIDSYVDCPAPFADGRPRCPKSEYPCGHHRLHSWGTPTDSRCTFCGGDS